MIRISPAARIKLIGGGILGLVIFTSFLFKGLRDYRLADSQPIEMTIAQVTEAAVREPFVPRWIRITEPLQIDCLQSRQWTEDGKTSTVVLAFDAAKQQAFWLEYRGSIDCRELRNTAFEGMLVVPEKFWKKQGMVQPSSSYHLVELSIGETPSDLRIKVESFAAADLLFIAMLCVGFLLPGHKGQEMAASTGAARAIRP
jgi:hypothetical protein